MSDFTDLCESMGLSPGDPDAVDIMIRKFSEDDDGDDEMLEDYYGQLGFEFDESEEEDMEDDDER